MPPTKKTDLEKLAWAWVEQVAPEDIQQTHLQNAYRIGLKNCKNCKRNCTNNPMCLTGLGEEKYMKSQPAEVASLESSLAELRDPTQYVGLKNLGATCYVNSLIQVWFHNEDMRRIIYKWNLSEDPEEREGLLRAEESRQPYLPVTVVGQLQYIFAMMQFGNRELLDPTNLAIALSLDTRTQQDAQEFSKLLLCHIEGKLQQDMALKAKLQRLTQGKYSYVNCCSTCGTEYPTSTTFYELDLQLAPTLKEAIEKYLSEEELVGPNQYHCTTCNDKKDARRFIRLDALPETLNIQLLRFVFHRDSGQKRKLNSFIQFPEDLDMSKFVRCPPLTHNYSLVAVLSHKGPSAHSGHYIANICNSGGEWYQFSDDKVEKMQNKRIEDGITDTTTKAVKRGRVPKGFLSSNTAYMLVYKRLTADSKLAGKRNKMRKLMDGEATNHAQIEKPLTIIDLVSDEPTSDEGKRKNFTETSTSVSTNNANTSCASSESPRCNTSTGKRTRNDSDILLMEIDETEKKPRLSPEQKNMINGIIGYHEDETPEIEAKIPKIEETTKAAPTQNMKIEYGLLNGDAHRNMSCGERDYYENMEFEAWELSGALRDLVREENVKHELSLLAVQQEKQKDVEDQNAKRQLVIDFYAMLGAFENECNNYQWIPSDWLIKWLNYSNSDVAPIDNSTLMCPHFRLDPLKVNRAKCVPPEAAEMLYRVYRGGPRLDENSLCDACVKKRCKMLRFKSGLERDHKEVGDIMRNFKEPSETSFIVGAESLRCWRRLVMESFMEEMEHEIDDRSNNDSAPEESKSSSSPTSGKDPSEETSTKDADESEENEAVINFNEDLLCEHKALKTPDSSRKLVPANAWAILKKYFPESKEYSALTFSCRICEAKMESAQKAKEGDKIKAKVQKDELGDLYYNRLRNEIVKCVDPDKVFYIVEKGFLDSWRSFIRYAEHFCRVPPPGIQNSQLLCEAHKGFLHHPNTISELYTIVTAEEWMKLLQFYEVDQAIIVRNTGGNELVTEPELCAVCMLARVEQERLEALKYDKATIYIKCVDDNTDEGKSDNDSKISAKRSKMETTRPSRTRRKVKGSHELKVSSDITLKELKVMTMPFCGAGPYDQHLMLGEHELTDHSQSLASLGILPGALLTLKIDTPIDSEADVETDPTSLDAATLPEKGFKGTELVPSGSG